MTPAIEASNTVNLQQFLRILSSQLTNQDPLEPLENQEFLSQIAQFSALQQTQQLNDKIDTLLTTQASLQTIGVLGRDVVFTTANGTTANGRVTSLTTSANNQLTLTVSPASGPAVSNINFSQITSIR